MSKYRDLDRGDVLPASWTDALQEFVSTLASNVDIQQQSATSIKVPAGTGSDQAAIGIGGLWRYRSTDASASVPGSTPGTYDIFVTATANSFATTPTPDTDNTDYNFGLTILAQGSTPTGVAAYRKIGEVDYDGSTITFIRNTLDRGRTLHAASHEPGGDDELDWTAVKGALALSVADLSEGSTGTGAVVRANSPTLTGTATFATVATTTFSGTPNFSGAATGQTAAVDDSTTKLATTAYVVGQGYLKSAAAASTYAPIAGPSFTGQVKIAAGTAAAPGLVPTGDLDTGIFQSSANTLSIATGGALAAQFGSTGNLNIIGQYQVGGSQIAAANLANGTTGTGSIVLAAGPTLTGTTTLATAAISTLTGNPNFTGAPTAVTPAAGVATTQIATTQFVDRDFVAKAQANTLTKAQTIAPDSDVTPLTLRRGTDTAPTANYLTGRNQANTQTLWSVSATGKGSFAGLDAGSAKITALANGSAADDAAAFGQIPLAATATPLMDGTGAVGTAVKWAREDHVHPIDTSRAPLSSPALTGTPTAPTAAVDTSTTQLATTAFVIGQASAVGDGTPAMDGTAARGASTHFARADHVHPTDTSRQAAATDLTQLSGFAAGTGIPVRTAANTWALRSLAAGTGISLSNADGVAGSPTIAVNTTVIAPLASPTFTGDPKAPTPAQDDNDTSIATTAFVLAQASSSNPLMDSAAAVGTSTRWARADHVHPSDTSRAALSGGNSFTGAQTITQSGDGLVLRSGGAANDALIDLGRTAQEAEIGIVGTAGNQFSGSAVGDLTIRQNALTKAIRLGLSTGTPSAAELVITDGVVNATGTLQQGGTAVVLTSDARLSDSRAPSGAAGGDLAGTYPNPTIKAGVGLSGSPTATTAAADDSSTRIATTAFVLGQLATSTPLAAATAGAVGTSTRAARADHVHPIPTDLGSVVTAGTLTGITVRTSGAAGSSASGVAFDSSGLHVYNTTPNITFDAQAPTGKIVIGAGAGNTTTQRIEADRTSIRFYGNSATETLTWTTIAVADPPGTGATVSRGQLTTNTDTAASRLWLDAKGLHTQIKIGAAAPFRTLDFDPNDVNGMRLHTQSTTDAMRVDPINGTTFKLADENDPTGDRSARWVRPADGTVAAKSWGDVLGAVADSAQFNNLAYAKAGQTAQTRTQAQVGTADIPTTFARIITTANYLGISSVQAITAQGAGDSYTVTLIRSEDGRTVLNYLEMGEMTNPPAPAANNARLYVRDNGSGKTQLAVRFPTGAIQVIATEP